ncbi:M42 family metallopeptidase [Risungbinella massiliensis]|uniref:M42 family metallopeptidase n=1 Tax=Risungbinella massiliensis TaxID=1329796 RepID=UPI0005CBA7E2|nr:M42 family metallopeptidase [Risungbinella massiliensis]
MNTFPAQRVVETLKRLLEFRSPTGYTDQIIDYIEQELRDYPILTLERTTKGGLIATYPGTAISKRVVTAHVDTLGAMVKEINGDGKIRLAKVGGYGWFSVDGVYCTIHTSCGKEYTGTILDQHTSVHVYRDADRKKEQPNMFVRLDEKAHTKGEVEKLGISVGDFVSFAPQVEVTDSGFIKSRHLDDKASVAVLLELAKSLCVAKVILPHPVQFYFSNWEEVGHGTSSCISEHVREFLAVDMGAIGEGQSTDEYSVSICAMDGSGPYHYGFRQKLVQLAKEHQIPYQLDLYPYYASDASASVRAGNDIIHGLIGPGVDASHAYERTHRDALESTYRLVSQYLLTPTL